MKLFDVFSDNALFQADSTLTIRGVSDPGAGVFVRLLGHNATAQGRANADRNGVFEVTVDTPDASYRKYEIVVTDGNETVTLKNIIFGELWIASGQSNMQLGNGNQFEGKEFLDSIKSLDIRVFAQDNGSKECFPLSPENETAGRWVSTLDPSGMMWVSACATVFCCDIYERLKQQDKDIPIGFLNVSWGGTPIYGWLPEDALTNDSKAYGNLVKRGILPVNETGYNAQSAFAMFNRKIAPIRGIKARGLIWYQGEYDSFSEYNEHMYKHFLYMLHDVYAELFAHDKGDFKVISSLIYPCNYTGTGDTNVGCLNDAFVKAAKEYPETYPCFPIYDLPPSWWPLDTNHPIHPLHKYALGKRMALVALRNVYGVEGQKLPSLMREWRIDGSRIILTFDKADKGLYTNDGKHVRGMYIAGKDNVYMPADCEILSDSELAVSHPYLDNPCNCLYGWSSFEVNLNLFSGDFPILPFATDDSGENRMTVELKPFLNLEVQSALQWFEDSRHTGEWYYRPVWKALPESDVCTDNAFTMHTEGYNVSLGVGSYNNSFGVYTTSHSGHALDLHNYSSFELDVFGSGKLSLDVLLHYDDGKGTKIEAKYSGDSAMYFKHYSIDLRCIPEGKISKMTLMFNVDNGKIYKYVNIGRLYLCPKNN